MRVNPINWARILSAIELLSAIIMPDIWLFVFNAWEMEATVNVFSIVMWAGFIIVPVLTFVGMIFKVEAAFWGLYIFPVIAYIFGVGAIPFVAELAPPVYPRGLLLTFVNMAAIVLAVFLRRNCIREDEGLRSE